MSSQAPMERATVAIEYWPQRWIETVRDETLGVWRKELEKKADGVHAELARVEGGIAQIDRELVRREGERKRKREVHGV